MRRRKTIRKGFAVGKFTNWYPIMVAALIIRSIDELVAPKNINLLWDRPSPARPRITPVLTWLDN
jgi:hypothetical protein